jgi:hypothetical protein
MRVNSPLNTMIYYRFHISFNGIYPIVKLCPVGHCSKYKAWKFLKDQYPNHFVSYVGKYCDNKLTKKLEIMYYNKTQLLQLIETNKDITVYCDWLSDLNYRIRQLEFRLT